MPRLPEDRVSVDWTLPARKRPSDPERFVEVWIDVDRFDESWFYTDQYLRHPREASVSDREAYAEAGQRFLAGQPVQMPLVRRDAGGLPSFIEGRHRYVWMREHGAVAMPIAVLDSDARAIRAVLGTRRRASWFIPRLEPIPNAVIYGMIGLAAAAMGLLVAVRS